MKTYLLLLYILTTSLHAASDDYVVFLHGFLGTPGTMKYLKTGLKKEGWTVINWGYPSREKWIQEHAADLVEELKIMHLERPDLGFHYVTHSMGGLVLRAALNHPECPERAKWGKAVLLAPPNGGACWARFLKNVPFTKSIAKSRAGKELLEERLFDYLGEFPPSLNVLVIAGNGGSNPIIGGENDGTVAVRETYLNTPHQHEVINAGHKSIVLSKKALKLIKDFLEK